VFGLGFWELVVIAVVALLFIGPEKMPNFFRALGRATREFQRASRELRENLSLDEPPPARKPPLRRPPTDVVPTHPGGVPKAYGRSVELPAEPAPAAPQPWPTAEDAERRARAAAVPPIMPPVKAAPTSAPAVTTPAPSEPTGTVEVVKTPLPSEPAGTVEVVKTPIGGDPGKDA